MVRNTFLRSAALAVIAAVGALAVPAQAQEGGRDEARAAAREARMQARQERRADAPQQAQAPRAEYRRQAPGGDDGRRAAWQARAVERQQQRAVAVPQRAAPDAGWRAQRSAQGARFGRAGDGDRVQAQAPQPGQRAVRTWRGSDSAAVRGDRASRGEAWRDRSDRGVNVDARRTARDSDRSARDGYRGATSYDRDGYRAGARYGADTYRTTNRYDRSRSGWDRDDWRRDRRYDWSSYRSSNRALFSIGRYYSPYRNYSYRRLGIGFVLDDGFYGNRYWINDPWQYRLPEVYGPYRWVRYYDDVLLVDIYSGEVVDAIHDFFW